MATLVPPRATPPTPVFTDEEVENLNRYQASGVFHEFTCGRDHEGSRTLVATNAGWVCASSPECGYTQDWAHDTMKTFTQDKLDEHRAMMGGLWKS